MPTILGTLKRHFRDRGWVIRPPRAVQERYLHVAAMIGSLTNDLQRSPTVAEIADGGNWSEAEVREALEAADHRHHHGLHDDDDGVREPATVDTELANVEHRAVVELLLEQLQTEEREIISMRYFDDLAQTAIAERIGMSQMHVSRVLTRTLHRLRALAIDQPA
jgi:RNA polymerase sigma-B factor